MAYILFTQSFGVTNANKVVRITNTSTGGYATIMASSTGGVVSTIGKTTLDSQGNLSVYLDEQFTWVARIPESVQLTMNPSVVYTGVYANLPDPTKFPVESLAIAIDQSNSEYTNNGVAWTLGGSTGVTSVPATYLILPRDGSDQTTRIQSAIDAIYIAGGGDLIIGPSTKTNPHMVGMLIKPPQVNLIGYGKGLTIFKAVPGVPLSTVYSRVESAPGSGIWSVGNFPAEARAFLYCIPQAYFDPSGTVATSSTDSVIGYCEGWSYDGNKTNQSYPISCIYAPSAKSDPEWPRVAGAYNAPGYPSGTIDLSATTKAYDCFEVSDVEAYNCTGTPFYGGADRHRARLGPATRGVDSGIASGGVTTFDAAGYKFYGDDCVIDASCNFSGNTSPVEVNGGAGSNRSQIVAGYQNIASPNAALSILDKNVSSAVTSGSTLTAGYRADTTSNGAYTYRGIVVSGIDGRIANQLHGSGTPTGNPYGVVDDSHNGYTQFRGYRQCVVAASVFSCDGNGKSFKYHATAIDNAGVRYSGIASSEPGIQSYVAATPFYTDSTGAIGYDYFDPYTKTLHVGVHTNNLTTTGSVVFDSPVTFTQGTSGYNTATTWAAIAGTTAADGTIKFAGDLGPAGIQYIYRTSTSKWTPMFNKQCLYFGTGIVGVASAAEQLMVAVPLPAFVLKDQVFEITFATSNTGSVDAETVVAVRLNSTATAGTLGVNEIILGTLLTAAQGSIGRSPMQFIAASTTTVKKLGTAGYGNGSFSAQTNTSANTTTTVPSFTSPMYLCFVIQMAGTTDIPTLSYLRLDLVSA